MIRPLISAVLVSVAILACAFVVIAWSVPVHAGGCQTVWASWYGKETCRKGKVCQTADGTPFDGTQWLVAHKSLRFGTMLRLTYKGRSVDVPVRDRGPFIAGRTLDVSEAVAKALGMKRAGVVRLCMEVL